MLVIVPRTQKMMITNMMAKTTGSLFLVRLQTPFLEPPPSPPSLRVWAISHGSRLNVFALAAFLSMWSALPDLAREVRFWSSPTCHTVPFWLVAVLVGAAFCCGCLGGACLAGFAFSAGIRRALVSLLRLFVSWLDLAQGAPEARAQLAQRLREYRLRG